MPSEKYLHGQVGDPLLPESENAAASRRRVADQSVTQRRSGETRQEAAVRNSLVRPVDGNPHVNNQIQVNSPYQQHTAPGSLCSIPPQYPFPPQYIPLHVQRNALESFSWSNVGSPAALRSGGPEKLWHPYGSAYPRGEDSLKPIRNPGQGRPQHDNQFRNAEKALYGLGSQDNHNPSNANDKPEADCIQKGVKTTAQLSGIILGWEQEMIFCKEKVKRLEDHIRGSEKKIDLFEQAIKRLEGKIGGGKRVLERHLKPGSETKPSLYGSAGQAQTLLQATYRYVQQEEENEKREMAAPKSNEESRPLEIRARNTNEAKLVRATHTSVTSMSDAPKRQHADVHKEKEDAMKRSARRCEEEEMDDGEGDQSDADQEKWAKRRRRHPSEPPVGSPDQ